MQKNNEELTYADHIRARGIDQQARDLAHIEAELAAWIEHDGRGCPVEIHQLVNLRYRDGTIKRNKKAGDRCWVNYDRADDIAAYQIVTENE